MLLLRVFISNMIIENNITVQMYKNHPCKFLREKKNIPESNILHKLYCTAMTALSKHASVS